MNFLKMKSVFTTNRLSLLIIMIHLVVGSLALGYNKMDPNLKINHYPSSISSMSSPQELSLYFSELGRFISGAQNITPTPFIVYAGFISQPNLNPTPLQGRSTNPDSLLELGSHPKQIPRK